MSLLNPKKVYPCAWAEIDLSAIKHNVGQMKKFAERDKFSIPGRDKQKIIKSFCGILPVIKAQAYGHGMVQVAKVLEKEGVDCLGVFNVSEGMELRHNGIKSPILLLESTFQENTGQIIDYNLIPTVSDLSFAQSLNKVAIAKKKQISIHIKVDTGMGRLGVWHEDGFDFIKKVYKLKRISVYGIYTHFPVADTDKKFTQKQIKSLYDLVVKLDKSGMVVPYIHASNSMGLAGYRTNVLNLSRPGLMIYGLYPSNQLKMKIDLKPAMSIHSKVSFVKTIKKGEGVSYGLTFKAKKNTPVAIVPIGYNDGYLRAFSNKAFVLINGERCKVIGNVTMNQIIVDVSRLKKVNKGDAVVIIGAQKKQSITADELAKYANTINYEIVCSLGNRLPRVYLEDSKKKLTLKEIMSLDLFSE